MPHLERAHVLEFGNRETSQSAEWSWPTSATHWASETEVNKVPTMNVKHCLKGTRNGVEQEYWHTCCHSTKQRCRVCLREGFPMCCIPSTWEMLLLCPAYWWSASEELPRGGSPGRAATASPLAPWCVCWGNIQMYLHSILHYGVSSNSFRNLILKEEQSNLYGNHPLQED